MRCLLDANLNPEGSCLANKLGADGASPKDILTLILDLFQGAMGTVPLTLTWALYHVSRCPDIQELARKDLLRIMPTKDSRYYESAGRRAELLFQASNASPIVQAILRETLRLSPPAIGNGRINSKDLILGGYLVPAGNMIVLQSQAACRLEEYFERPLEFIPDRFIHSEKYHKKGGVNRPFGFGPRACIGQPFAHGQSTLALSKVLRNFEVTYNREEVGVINRLHNEPDRPVIFKLDQIPY
ncbi:cytochrome P450 302a1, mitochondrial [Trichonephila clavata]|uniref:Cytochrome P450 302a1, mitochondrial n=1 Tax=Trichonephila clavata TaxID=2740835 RepID=A0A8X6FPV2_TRICU|nr:cytochrome P450 302a1, mitochondrial [Trichonephila clavata]